MAKIWEIAPKIDKEFENKFPEISPIILQLLWNRKLTTQEKIDEFLLPDYSQDIHDPFLFNQMELVVERIKKAVDSNEKITVYGDYDADGICGTAVLYSTLLKIGANVFYYLPDREKEGYGLKIESVQKIIDEGTSLIITVDCGITNLEEAIYCKEKGIDLIITDHHLTLEKLPEALFIINPWVKEEKYPFKELAGVGVAFKVVQALLKKYPIKNSEAFEKWLLDLVAVGSVADMVSLLGENRTLVKYGLIVLNKTFRMGLRYLFEKAKINLGEIDTRSIGLKIASRLNAAGRIDHANLALEMVLSEDIGRAKELAEKLGQLNEIRQQRMEKIFEEIKKEIGDLPTDKMLVIYKKDWPVGILGTTAHRLTDLYNRPVILITVREQGVKGCGRSVDGFNLIDFLKKTEEDFLQFGGHAGAAGFTLKENDLKKLDNFCQKLRKIAEKELNNFDFYSKILIDIELKISDINWRFYEEITKLEPFGENNPPPIFLVKGIEVEEIRKVGKTSQHLKMTAGKGRKMIYFKGASYFDDLKRGDKIDVVFELNESNWNGSKELDFKILDLKKHESY